MSKITSINGQFYPIRDECKKIGDPIEGCITTNALYYETILKTRDIVSVVITHKNNTILSESYPSHIQITYKDTDLGCSNDKY